MRQAVRDVLLLLLLLAPVANAAPALRDLHREVWTTASGLPHNLVPDAAQTPEGYLWFATWEGVVRYNGHRFDLLDEAYIASLPERGVSELALDKQGRLLVGLARGGLLRREGNGWRTLNLPADAAGAAVYALAEDAGGVLVGSAGHGLLRLQQGSERIAQPAGLDQGIVYAIGVDGERTWLGTDSGLALLQRGRLQRFGTEQGLPAAAVLSLVALGDGAWALGTERGAFRWDGERASALHPELPLASFEALLRDSRGALWLGTAAQGLFRLGERGLETLDQADGLPANRVASLFEDREGSIWAGTSGGLLRLRAAPFFSLTGSRGLVDDYVRTLLETADGDLWFGTAGGLSRLRGDGSEGSALHHLLAGESVLSLAPGQGGELWVGTYYTGLLRLRDGVPVQRYAREEGLPGNQVRALQAEPDGRLWVGTHRGLALLGPEGIRSIGIDQGLDQINVLALHRDADGRLWVGAADGMARGENGMFVRERGPALAAVQRVYGFADDAQGGLWAASDRGLLRLHNGQWRRLGPEHGLPVGAVFAVVTDDEGNLWLSSNRGVLFLHRSEVEAVFAGAERLARYEMYGEADGMASSQCNGASGVPALRRSDGALWFATAGGGARVRPGEAAQFARQVPTVVLEQVMVDGQPQPIDGPLQFPAGARRLQLQFAGLSYQAPGKVRYRYQLEGFDRDWVYSGRDRLAQFTNLAPGNYRFRGSAANPNGEWSAHEAVLELRVLPLWWQRPWLQVLLAVALLGLVVLTVRLRLRVLEASERRLREQVDGATRDLRERNLELDAYAHTVAHDLKSPLTTVLGLARLLDQAGVALGPEQRSGAIARIHATAQKMAAIIDALLLLGRSRSDSAVELSVVHNLPLVREVVQRLDELALQHAAEVRMPESLPAVRGYAPWVEQVWVNFISNAIKYGGEPPQVEIGGEREPGGRVRLWVRDHGRGLDDAARARLFQPFARIAEVAGDGHGLGLSIVRRLVERMGGEVGCDSLPGAGATFWFRLPAAD